MWKKILIGVGVVIVVAIVLAIYFTQTLSDVAGKQLEALRNNDLIRAYAYTSRSFQRETSLKDFESFVNRYSALKNNLKSSWSDREISNNLGTLKGTLTAIDGAVTPIEYRFVRENNEWRILGILLHETGARVIAETPTSAEPAAPVTSATPQHAAPTPAVSNEISGPAQPSVIEDKSQGEIYQVLVSDVQGKDGSVDATRQIISMGAPKIFASVYILHAKVGLKVATELVRVANGAKIGPNIAIVSRNGDIIRDFSFTNTAPSWPAGKYKINVATSNGETASVNFQIQ
ncbi:MAG: DUF4864 domain-containing protein [Gammaproteobacteria bacterium]|nr:DUF4864 domain-containing protein [Gammaproteobacteria bacterium]